MKKTILTMCAVAAIVACNTRSEKTSDKTTCSSEVSKIKSDFSGNFDEDFKGCQAGCGISEYDESDIVSAAGAEVGDITQCPVSGAIFQVKEDSPVLTHDDKTFYSCCTSCAERFKEDPDRFAKNVYVTHF